MSFGQSQVRSCCATVHLSQVAQFNSHSLEGRKLVEPFTHEFKALRSLHLHKGRMSVRAVCPVPGPFQIFCLEALGGE